MKEKTLYIIGNGFDIYHGIKSKYSHFKEYIKNNSHDLFLKLEEYFYADDLWSDFEETLADLDTDSISDKAMKYLDSYGDENWSESSNYAYQLEVQKRIDIVTIDLKKQFTEWILQLEVPRYLEWNKLLINRNSLFLNFNYTNTLEKLYKVPEKNILYIHHKAIDNNSSLILGHSRNPKETKTLSELYNNAEQDPRIVEGSKILDSYFTETYKSTSKIIKENIKFFKQLKNIRVVYILGHSLSKVDFRYFQEIVKNINLSDVKWKVSIYSIKELAHHREVLNKLGIENHLIEFGRIHELKTIQLRLFQEKDIVENNNKNN